MGWDGAYHGLELSAYWLSDFCTVELFPLSYIHDNTALVRAVQ